MPCYNSWRFIAIYNAIFKDIPGEDSEDVDMRVAAAVPPIQVNTVITMTSSEQQERAPKRTSEESRHSSSESSDEEFPAPMNIIGKLVYWYELSML